MLEETLCSFKNCKTPGVDDLPKEFHMAFWEHVASDLLEVFRE